MKQSRGPLRKVIGYEAHPDYPDIVDLVREVYECGHVALPKRDIYGETHAYRRYCRACKSGLLADVDVESFKGRTRKHV